MACPHGIWYGMMQTLIQMPRFSVSSLYAVFQVSAVCTLHVLSMVSAGECWAQGSNQIQEAASRRPPCLSLRLWSSAALASSGRQ